MRYATAAAFRQALDDRLKSEAARTDRFVLKGALALELATSCRRLPTIPC
jgi:hypothetical protein